MTARGNPGVRIAFIGFGEAASAFVEGWGAERAAQITAYDIKTGDPSPEISEAKRGDYIRAGVTGRETPGAALDGAGIVFSTVTADQALAAAISAVNHIPDDALYLDCNSCSPGAKREACEAISKAGGRYVDVAVMAPVRPGLHRVPLLISGDCTARALVALEELGMSATVVDGGVGAASSVKMIRSIVMKGLEAIVAECVLSGRKAGVDGLVLDSLEKTYPGFNWKGRAAYMLERVMTHGIRRAAEMREVALTVEQLGLGGGMARAAAEWQQRIGDMKLNAGEPGGRDYRALADAILENEIWTSLEKQK